MYHVEAYKGEFLVINADTWCVNMGYKTFTEAKTECLRLNTLLTKES